MWNVILNTLNKNEVVAPKNNPTKDGQYVCTCIIKVPNENKYYGYLRIMEYKADENYWHDIGNKYRISHTILAWKEEEICDYSNFKYKAGILFKQE